MPCLSFSGRCSRYSKLFLILKRISQHVSDSLTPMNSTEVESYLTFSELLSHLLCCVCLPEASKVLLVKTDIIRRMSSLSWASGTFCGRER